MAKYLRLDQRSRLSVFLAATAIALPAAAFAQATPPTDTMSASAIPAAQEEVTVYVQGATKERGTKAVDNPKDKSLPALPVVYEDEVATPAPVTPAA